MRVHPFTKLTLQTSTTRGAHAWSSLADVISVRVSQLQSFQVPSVCPRLKQLPKRAEMVTMFLPANVFPMTSPPVGFFFQEASSCPLSSALLTGRPHFNPLHSATKQASLSTSPLILFLLVHVLILLLHLLHNPSLASYQELEST